MLLAEELRALAAECPETRAASRLLCAAEVLTAQAKALAELQRDKERLTAELGEARRAGKHLAARVADYEREVGREDACV